MYKLEKKIELDLIEKLRLMDNIEFIIKDSLSNSMGNTSNQSFVESVKRHVSSETLNWLNANITGDMK